MIYARGVKLIFNGGHISLAIAFKGPNVILGLYKCNYSLTRGKELALPPGRNKVEGQIVFATCALKYLSCNSHWK